jgi:hypothetical protein
MKVWQLRHTLTTPFTTEIDISPFPAAADVKVVAVAIFEKHLLDIGEQIGSVAIKDMIYQYVLRTHAYDTEADYNSRGYILVEDSESELFDDSEDD